LSDKKTRTYTITVTAPAGSKGQIQINSDGLPRLVDEHGKPATFETVHLTVSHKRDVKSPKTILELPLDPTKPSFNPHFDLTRYQALLAIDTNSCDPNRLIDGIMISVTTTTEIKIKETGVDLLPCTALEFHNVHERQEQYGWMLLCRGIQNEYGAGTPEPPIGFVVDCDQNNLKAMNARRVPIWGDFYLPAGFELIYASGDKKNDSIFNRALALSDHEANRIFRKIRQEGSVKKLNPDEMHLWEP
jgi:hypothetical protein